MQNCESISPDGSPAPQRDPLDQEHLAILEMQANFCRVMGHPVRLFLLHYINHSDGEVGSSELAEKAGIRRATLSQHLGKMTAAGLVRTRREGKYVRVRLAREEIGQACDLVRRALQSELRQRSKLVETPEEPE